MDDITDRNARRPNRPVFTVGNRPSAGGPPVALRPLRPTGTPPTPVVPSAPSAPVQQPSFAAKRPFETKTPVPKNSGKSKKKFIIALLLILLLAGAAGAGYWFVLRDKPDATVKNEQLNQPTTVEVAKPLEGNFRIVATGDMITFDTVNQGAKKADNTYDYAPMLADMKPLLDKAHVRICHDTVSSASGLPISGYPSFNAPDALIAGLGSSGCNVLGLASDHMADKGQVAIDATRTAIDAQKSIVVAAGANRSVEEQEKEGVFNVGDGQARFSYFSFTTRQATPATTPFGVNVYSKGVATAQIKKVKELGRFVIVSMCWGKEDSVDVIPEQETIAQELADAGADVVFGHCTHTVQPVKRVKATSGDSEAIVFLSLGNALSSQLPIESLIGGLGVVDFDLATKKITNIGLLPTYMHYEWSAADKASKNVNARRNLKLMPLDKAEAALAASQNGTTVAAQIARVTEIANRFGPVKLYTSADF